MSYFSDTFYNDEFYKKINDKVFEVILSCKTVEQYDVAIKFIDLATDMLDKHFHKQYTPYVISFSSFRRGYCHGQIHSLIKQNKQKEKIEEETRLP